MVGPNSSFQYLRGGYQGARAIAELFTAVQGRMTRVGKNRKKQKKKQEKKKTKTKTEVQTGETFSHEEN